MPVKVPAYFPRPSELVGAAAAHHLSHGFCIASPQAKAMSIVKYIAVITGPKEFRYCLYTRKSKLRKGFGATTGKDLSVSDVSSRLGLSKTR